MKKSDSATTSSADSASGGSDSTTASKETNKTGVGGRSFQKQWKDKYKWILYDEKCDKVFCSVCKEIISSSGPFAKKLNKTKT